MADDIKVNAATGVSDPAVATDDIGSKHYQKIKAGWGADGTWNETDDSSGKRIPTNVAESALIGATNESAAASDTATSGLNGLLKRIAQRLTSLIALFPAALTTNGSALKTGSVEAVLTAKVVSGQTVQGTGVDLSGLRNWGILVPTTFDGTTITFATCDTLGGTYVSIYDITNTIVTLPVNSGRYYDIPGELMGVRFLKIVTGSTQAGSDTDFLIIGKS